jgi:hypothetical protein
MRIHYERALFLVPISRTIQGLALQDKKMYEKYFFEEIGTISHKWFSLLLNNKFLL